MRKNAEKKDWRAWFLKWGLYVNAMEFLFVLVFIQTVKIPTVDFAWSEKWLLALLKDNILPTFCALMILFCLLFKKYFNYFTSGSEENFEVTSVDNWLVRQQPNRLKNLVFEVSSVFGVELVLKVETIRLNALLGAFGKDHLHTATWRRAVLDLRRRVDLERVGEILRCKRLASVKFVIAGELGNDVEKLLKAMNITQRTIYPDITGIAPFVRY